MNCRGDYSIIFLKASFFIFLRFFLCLILWLIVVPISSQLCNRSYSNSSWSFICNSVFCDDWKNTFLPDYAIAPSFLAWFIYARAFYTKAYLASISWLISKGSILSCEISHGWENICFNPKRSSGSFRVRPSKKSLNSWLTVIDLKMFQKGFLSAAHNLLK